jgi:hypothetical protein
MLELAVNLLGHPWTTQALAFILGLNGLHMMFKPPLWWSLVPGVGESGPLNHHFVRDVGMLPMALVLFTVHSSRNCLLDCKRWPVVERSWRRLQVCSPGRPLYLFAQRSSRAGDYRRAPSIVSAGGNSAGACSCLGGLLERSSSLAPGSASQKMNSW